VPRAISGRTNAPLAKAGGALSSTSDPEKGHGMDKKTVLELASAFAFLDAANIGDDSHAIWSAEDFYTDVINDIMVEQIGLQGISEDVAKAQAFAKQMFETGVSDFDPSWVEEQFGLGDHVDRHGLELNGLEEVASQTRSLPNEVSDVIWYDVFDDEVHISEVFGNDYIEYEDGCYQICTTQ
jgi:hypothetical protein